MIFNSNSADTKRCSLFCEDGFSQEVHATCGESNDWELESSADALGMYSPGCQTCSANSNSTFPISDGGRWKCHVIITTEKSVFRIVIRQKK